MGAAGTGKRSTGFRALVAFGAPTEDLRESDLATRGLIYQIGVPPVRIDIITEIEGVEFAEVWRDRVRTEFAGEPVAVLSVQHLIKNKRAAGRLQDLADVERLEALQRRGQ